MLQAILNALTFGATAGAAPGDRSYDLGDPRAVEIFGSNRSNTGVPVNSESALSCSSWYRAIDLLSDSIGKTPVGVFRNLPDDGGLELDRKHPWFRALSRKPGPNWTAFQFFKLMVAWMRSGGNAYAFIDRDNYELIPVCPTRMTPVIEGEGSSAKLWYVLDQQRKYHADEILHFKGFGFDGLVGYSVVDKAKQSIGLSLGAGLHQAKTLKNSGRPSVLLTMPGKMTKPARDELLAGWQKMHSGGDNAGRTAVLDNGMKAEPYAFTSQDMELMETQKFTVRDISNFTGVPAHKLGDNTGQAFNSLEQQNLSLLGDTQEPIIVNVEQELEDKLLTEKEKEDGSHEIRLDRKALSATDTTTKAAYWRTALGGHPWATVAEARRAFGENHIEGTDEIPEPANMMKGGEANQPNDATGERPKEGWRRSPHLHKWPEPHDPVEWPIPQTQQTASTNALDAGVRRLFRRLGNQARAKTGKPSEFVEWVDSLKKENLEAALEELADLASVCAFLHGAMPVNVALRALNLAESEFKSVAESATTKTLPAEVAAVSMRLLTVQFPFFETKV